MAGVRLGITIMHHPSRADRLPRLIRGCAPYSPTVVTDPDPTGPPSPLRTAKVAWAVSHGDATHHLVLQDDAVLADGFTGHLLAALEHCPAGGATLCVTWNSPQNSYRVRRAAAAGAAWAPLSREWVPTWGLVLPAGDAKDLAGYLRGFPDSHRHDDDLVAGFCRERAVSVAATVPHLLDHAELPSLAGNDTHGDRQGAVVTDLAALPREHWASPALPGEPPGHAMELHNSECRIRYVRSDAGEPLEHPFGWYWHDWCGLLGVPPEAVLDALDEALSGPDLGAPGFGALPERLVTEVWAAGYLLGAGLPAGAGRRARPAVLRAAVTSWVASGLTAPDRERIGGAARGHLVDVGVAAVGRGGDRRG